MSGAGEQGAADAQSSARRLSNDRLANNATAYRFGISTRVPFWCECWEAQQARARAEKTREECRNRLKESRAYWQPGETGGTLRFGEMSQDDDESLPDPA